MLKTCLVLIVAVILGLSAAPLRAAQPPTGSATETNLDVLINSIRSNRKTLVAVNLNLSGDEAAKFWPIYDRYQQEMHALGDRMVGVIEDYTANFSTLSNEKAMQLMQDYLAIEADRIKVRRTYLDEFAKVLPGRTVARFYQLENKMDAVIRYDLAATIPVMEEQKGASAQ